MKKELSAVAARAPRSSRDTTPSALQVKRAIWVTRFQFVALGVLSGAWGVHIPSVKAHYGLGEMTLSLVLMSAAVGAVLSLLTAGRVIGSWPVWAWVLRYWLCRRHRGCSPCLLTALALSQKRISPGLAARSWS